MAPELWSIKACRATLLLALLPTAPAVAAESCQQIFAVSQWLHSGKDAVAWKELYAKAKETSDCDEQFLKGLGRKVAIAIVTEAEGRRGAGTPLDQLETSLTESLFYHRLWQALATLGDLKSDSRQFADAARRYDEALQVIADEELTPTPPQEEVIASIFRKAEENRLLAPQYVTSARSRTGDPAGLAARSIRGFIPTKVAIPVTFEYNSDAFTEQGLAAARDMLDYLKAQGAPSIILIGHTDPRGSDAYNQTLSDRRAQALRRFLSENGYVSEIEAIGKGESEPFKPDDPARYSEEERWQMDRRVELRRNSG
jgi:outer membrane protein OmpA-like peptidoglycan-associated protein